METLAELHTDVIAATPRWREAQAAQAFSAIPPGDIDPTADMLNALLTGAALPPGAELGPPSPALLLNFTDLTDRLVAAPRQHPRDEGSEIPSDPLEDADGVYEQFPEQFHNVAHAIRARRIAPGSKARLSELLGDADDLFAHLDVALVAELAGLAGSVETARRRLRLLLALDAMMLWCPDGLPGPHDGWWAVDDGSRARRPDLDVPDLLVYRKGAQRVGS